MHLLLRADQLARDRADVLRMGARRPVSPVADPWTIPGVLKYRVDAPIRGTSSRHA